MATVRSVMPLLVLGASLAWGVAACAPKAERSHTPNETDVGSERAGQVSQAPTKADAKSEAQLAPSEVLRPYLGMWRPTSSKLELNIGVVTLTETSLSEGLTSDSVTYELVTTTDNGVIVSVTGRHPPTAYSEVTALGFSLKTKTLDSFPPGISPVSQELLQICFGFGTRDYAIRKLVSEMKDGDGRCPYTYKR